METHNDKSKKYGIGFNCRSNQLNYEQNSMPTGVTQQNST